jgi:hypothetical protein
VIATITTGLLCFAATPAIAITGGTFDGNGHPNVAEHHRGRFSERRAVCL